MDRLYRLLFDATTEAGGGAANVTAGTAQAAAATTAPAAQAVVKPPDINLPWEDAQKLFAAERQLREIQVENQKKLDEKEQLRIKAIAEKEGADRALEEQRTSYEGRLNGLQSAFHKALTLTELANVTAATVFVNTTAAEQARNLMAARLEVRQVGEELKIVDKVTGRPAAEVVKTWLASEEFSHFQKATTQGGSGAGNSDVTVNQEVTQDKLKGLKWADLAILKAADQAAAPGTNPYSPSSLRTRVNRN